MSGSMNNLKGLGKGFTGGRSDEMSSPLWLMMGINARLYLGAGILPFPTMLRRVSGKNLDDP